MALARNNDEILTVVMLESPAAIANAAATAPAALLRDIPVRAPPA